MNLQQNLCAMWATLAVTCGSLVAAETPTLTIGSKAPAVKVDQWYKGKPFATFQPGGIHVVEFWATWCAPCKKAIPHLSELAATYKGKVSFTGICVMEEGEKIPARIKKFVTAMGNKMAYTVAGDTPDGQMARTWIQAAGENSIPQTFIVDGGGRIAWIGHPSDVETPIKQLIAGTYNLDLEARKRNEAKDGEALSDNLEKSIVEAIEAKDLDKAFARLRETLASTHPNKILLIGNIAPGLFRLDEARANAEFEALLKTRDGDTVLGAMGSLLDTDALSPRIYEMGLVGIQKQIDARPKEGFFWHLKAAGHFRLGNTAKAKECEEKALALLKADPEGSQEDLEAFQEAMGQYQKALKTAGH